MDSEVTLKLYKEILIIIILLMVVKATPQTESYSLSKRYPCLLAQPIAHRMRWSLVPHATFSCLSNMSDMRETFVCLLKRLAR